MGPNFRTKNRGVSCLTAASTLVARWIRLIHTIQNFETHERPQYHSRHTTRSHILCYLAIGFQCVYILQLYLQDDLHKAARQKAVLNAFDAAQCIANA